MKEIIIVVSAVGLLFVGLQMLSDLDKVDSDFQEMFAATRHEIEVREKNRKWELEE